VVGDRGLEPLTSTV